MEKAEKLRSLGYWVIARNGDADAIEAYSSEDRALEAQDFYWQDNDHVEILEPYRVVWIQSSLHSSIEHRAIFFDRQSAVYYCGDKKTLYAVWILLPGEVPSPVPQDPEELHKSPNRPYLGTCFSDAITYGEIDEDIPF